MEEEYDFLKSKNLEELVKIIDDFNDMDETVEAMQLLWEMDREKALEKGINFLWNNAGDEYFQAMIIDIIDDIDFCKVLDCLTRRKDKIQAYLLGEIMKQMVIYASYKYVTGYVNSVNKCYTLLNEKERKKIDEQYNKFINEFIIKNE